VEHRIAVEHRPPRLLGAHYEQIYPARIRGAGNGFAWAIAWLVGFVLWPFVAVWLTERTGSFAASFLIVPIAMLLMGAGIRLFTPDHVGKDLDSIVV
jgi:MFS family permease